jgi:hypothetical protein
MHIDDGLKHPVDSSKENYGWILESSTIVPHIIEDVKNRLDYYRSNFKNIFTCDRRILAIDPQFFKFSIPNAVPWIQNRKIYEKTKNVSIILSNKSGKPGYSFRLNFLHSLDKSKVDHYGRGFKTELPFSFTLNNLTESGKMHALKDYRFSFAFENDFYETYYCEKLTDCFATGTIPIFWGAPDIDKIYDTNGMIIFSESFSLDMLTEDYYMSKLESVKNNFETILQLPTAEDYIYTNYFK